MTTSPFPFVTPALLDRLSVLQPYCLVILRKGPNHDGPDTPRIIQAEHLPYLFALRDAGVVALSTPVLVDSDCRAVAIYNLADAEEVKKHVLRDPCVQKGVFDFDVLPVMGVPGDHLAKR